jgi:hypothetical protein
MAASPSPAEAVRALGRTSRAEAAALVAYGHMLEPSDWDGPSWCTGWTVLDG